MRKQWHTSGSANSIIALVVQHFVSRQQTAATRQPKPGKVGSGQRIVCQLARVVCVCAFWWCVVGVVCARTVRSGRTAWGARSCSCTCLGMAHIALAAGSRPSEAPLGLAQGSGSHRCTCVKQRTCHKWMQIQDELKDSGDGAGTYTSISFTTKSESVPASQMHDII
jgi:hypothetical protein